ncbi:MAG: cupin [Planctomycetota bacterium]|jgi:gentisate 1,2-dioxygenase
MANATATDPALSSLTRDGGYLEYTKAANPLASGAIPPIPIVQFPASLHAHGASRIIPLDISQQLGCESPASSASLLASFIRIRSGESLTLPNRATSHLLYSLEGRGTIRFADSKIPYRAGDLITLPCGPDPVLNAEEDTVFYWVNDEPLLRYLGVAPVRAAFEPTLYPRDASRAALQEAASDALASQRSRISVLLTNAHFPQTLTITHVLWAMLGILPIGANQLPHAHKSVALDLILECKPGCYTLVSERVDKDGNLIDPIQVPWEGGGAFITPPGWWHSHHNESGEPAFLMPIQDAGLHTYLRTLDIQFHRSNIV